ncbi:hypothetical protein M3Y94_00841500 [Aphelenchoides besseyi]|nr:hypothetical protein M3Y94_00841500 [Aphelenchoides besseyi]KAI6226918.1 hypothetical protein M3Y95_00671900 [Aphelenchoides besseyi]
MQRLVIFSSIFVLAIADQANRISPYSDEAKEYGSRLVREYSKEQNLEGRLEMLDVLKVREKPLYTPEGDYKIGRVIKEQVIVGVKSCSSASDNSCFVDDAFILNGTLVQVHEKEDQFAFTVVHNS